MIFALRIRRFPGVPVISMQGQQPVLDRPSSSSMEEHQKVSRAATNMKICYNKEELLCKNKELFNWIWGYVDEFGCKRATIKAKYADLFNFYAYVCALNALVCSNCWRGSGFFFSVFFSELFDFANESKIEKFL